MKFILLLALAAVAFSQPTSFTYDDLQQWELFKIKYNKAYDRYEEVMRRNIFMKNLQFVREHNEKYQKGEVSYAVAINEFSDMTPTEIARKMYGMRVQPRWY